jgi:hypothetical protein
MIFLLLYYEARNHGLARTANYSLDFVCELCKYEMKLAEEKNYAKGDVSLSQYRGGIYSPRGMAGSHGHF